MGRFCRIPTQDMAPAPTEALPIPEVPVSTEDLFAKRPRTKKDWVKKARSSATGTETIKASKGRSNSKAASAAPMAMQTVEDLPPTQRLPDFEEEASLPATQKLTEEPLVPTQQLAEDVVHPTQLAQETSSEHSPALEAPEVDLELSISQTQHMEPEMKVYGKCKRRRVKSSEGPKSPVVKVKAIGTSKPRRSSGMNFQDFVAMGKLKRGDPPGAEIADPQAGASQEEELPATQMVQDTLAPQPVEELEPESFSPGHLEAKSMDVEEALEAVATEKLDAEDAPMPTEKLDHAEEPDLQALLQRHISELEEVSTQMTQRQKALVGVYKALQAFL